MKIPRKKTIILTTVIIIIIVIAFLALEYFAYLNENDISYYLLSRQATKDFKNGNFSQACVAGRFESCGHEIYGGCSNCFNIYFSGENNSPIGSWQPSYNNCFDGKLEGKLAVEKNWYTCDEFFNALERYNQECNDCVKALTDGPGYEYYNLHMSHSFILWLYHIGILPQKVGF